MAYSYTSSQLCGQRFTPNVPSAHSRNSNSSSNGNNTAPPETMASIFHRLGEKLTRKSSNQSSRTNSDLSTTSSHRAPSPVEVPAATPDPVINAFLGISPPTRRPVRPGFNAFTTPSNEPPPAYSPPASSPAPPYTPTSPGMTSHSSFTSTADDPFAFLSTFDTHFLIDDSGSMAGKSWRQTSAALAAITPICTEHNANGVGISFLNCSHRSEFQNITSAASMSTIFSTIRPRGATPTGTRLHQILKPYLVAYELEPETTKPLNIIVITDGAASDDVESVLIAAAKKLDRLEAPAWQVGVQFFQVGNEPGAAEALRELDDELGVYGPGATPIRDMVDTVPWYGDDNGGALRGEAILKVVLGAVNRRLDRRNRV